MHVDLALVWISIIALGVFLYVLLDGFDLGIGLLLPFFVDTNERQLMINTIAPVWDGNETWLVFGGACLFAAFPTAYSVLLPANYLPLILMLCGLIFRGVSFELRAKARRTQQLWDLAFVAGSATASLSQGLVLATLLQGIPIEDGRFAGSPFDWVSPFGLMCGLGVMVTYATLGCGWLIMKTDGQLQSSMRQLEKPLVFLLVLVIAIVSVWTVLGQSSVAERWFDRANFIYFAPVPVLVGACALGILFSNHRKHQSLPFVLSIVILFLGYSGLLISIFPDIVPPSLTIWAASSPPTSQRFALVGVLIVLPIILAYTALSYWVFRGKVTAHDEGYEG